MKRATIAVFVFSGLVACSGASDPGSPVVLPSDPPAPPSNVLASFEGSFDAISHTTTIKFRDPKSGTLLTEANLVYGSVPGNVYLHTEGVGGDGKTPPTYSAVTNDVVANVDAENGTGSTLTGFAVNFTGFSPPASVGLITGGSSTCTGAKVGTDLTGKSAFAAPCTIAYGAVAPMSAYPKPYSFLSSQPWTFLDPANESFSFNGNVTGTISNLVGWWSFQDATHLGNDSSGNGYTLTVTGGATAGVGHRAGRVALNLDGGTGVLTAAAFPALIPTGNSHYTIAAWIHPSAPAGTYGIIGWGNYGNTNQVNAFRLNNGSTTGFQNYWWANDIIDNAAPVNFYAGWNHVAATFDGTTRSLWVNGVKVQSDTPSGHNVIATTFRIGETLGGEFFKGLLDDVRVYNEALTAPQMVSLASE